MVENALDWFVTVKSHKNDPAMSGDVVDDAEEYEVEGDYEDDDEEEEKEYSPDELVEYFLGDEETTKEIENIFSDFSEKELAELPDKTVQSIKEFCDAFDSLTVEEMKEFVEFAESIENMTVKEFGETYKAGGNFGHKGIPGHRGGSMPKSGGGAAPAIAQKKPGLANRFVNFVKRGGVVGAVARGAVGAGKKLTGKRQELASKKPQFNKPVRKPGSGNFGRAIALGLATGVGGALLHGAIKRGIGKARSISSAQSLYNQGLGSSANVRETQGFGTNRTLRPNKYS